MIESAGLLADSSIKTTSTRSQTPRVLQTVMFDAGNPRTSMFAPYAAPFVKWAGGKRKLLSAILNAAPMHFERYLEPFVGGGAVALAIAHPVMLLNDANPDLMNTYQAVKCDSDALMRLLDRHRDCHSESYYYQIRDQIAESLPSLEQAARLIYLNKTCFNGLYRVNRRGQFNVPYGRYEKPTLYDPMVLQRASKALAGTTLFTGDYRTFLDEHARAGDFIYLDPPYVPVGKYSDFKRYTKEQFRASNQDDLRDLYNELIRRGCYPVLSNSSTARSLYDDHEVIELFAARNINKNGAGRKAIPEILVKPRLSAA